MDKKDQEAKTRLQLFKQKLYIIIYGVNTPAGKAFDIALLVAILLSVFTIMLESVPGIDLRYHKELRILEWAFLVLFGIEYFLRIFVSKNPIKYVISFYGVIDLLSILPMLISIFFPGSHIFSSLRILRLLRVFRVLRLMEFMQESSKLKVALMASRAKIMVFLYTVSVLSILIGTLMYYIEGPENGFTSIPKSVFYTIVTLTTVGYGDMVPITPVGQFLSMVLMVIGYGIIAVPTGIVGVEFARQYNSEAHPESGNSPVIKHTRLNGIVCAHCNWEGHRSDADYCFHCGHRLNA